LSTCNIKSILDTDNRYKLRINRYTEIDYMDVKTMMKSIVSYGPLIAYVAASSPYFQMYASGVLDDPTCVSYSVDHVVLIVGYGTDNVTNTDYWLIKNSWNTDWGEVF
jgi:cathepsin L